MSGSDTEALRRALRELADADAGELVADARERARARAEKLIEDALVSELLDAVARTRTPRARVAPEHRAPAQEQPDAHVWWAYCVLSARDAGAVPTGLEGVEPGSAVEVLRHGELAALISAVPAAEYDDVRLREHLENLAWLERTARRHEAVLEAALQRATVVPLRLCTLYHDRDGVLRLLRDHGEPLARGLARIDGCAEWGVKVFGAQAHSAGPESSEVPEDGEAVAERPGATYLVQRQRERAHAERASELRVRCAEEVHQRASTCARESISNPPQRPELHGREMAMLLNGAYLIPHDHAEELHHTIDALQAEWEPQGFTIELTGPWPAYNFVSETAGVLP